MRQEGVLDLVAVETKRWPVTHRLPTSPDQADLAMRFVYRRLAESGLLASLGLVVQGSPVSGVRAWLTASMLDGEHHDAILRLVRATVPWLGLGPDQCALEGIAGNAVRFEVGRSVAGTHIVPEAATFARFLAGSQHPWQVTVQVGFAAPGDDDAMVDLGLSLVGEAADLSVAAPLLASDVLGHDAAAVVTPHHVHGDELDAILRDAASGRAPVAGRVPAGLAGRLMSLPARIEGTWQVVDAPPASSAAVIAAARSAVPPHVLVQGGSGQGKTTLLEHLVDASLEDGAAVVVVCPHGDLAARAAGRIAGSGAPLRVIDYGSEQPVPWNLTVPDAGVGREEHASVLTDVIRELWLQADADWFGPVWYRMMRGLISVLVRDPQGPHSIARLPELLDVESPLRDGAVERIGDRTLQRLVDQELKPMLAHKDPGNTVTWLISKLDHLIGDPSMRAIVGGRLHAVDVAPVLAGESLIVSVPERHLTPDGARVLASMVIGRLWLMLRRRAPEREIHLYVDEWQKLPMPALSQVLAEGRKRGLALRLANQNSAQIPATLWETATGNTGAIVSFRTGPRDAGWIAPMFGEVSAHQIARLPDHWVALTSGGKDTIAPGPAPLPGDGGAALATGHERTVAAVRHQGFGMVHGMVTALTQRLEAPPEAPPVDFLDEWLQERRRQRATEPEPTMWDEDADDDEGEDWKDDDTLGALPDPF